MLELKIAFSNFFNYCRFQKNLSSKTLKAYNIDTKQFLAYLESINTPLNINAIDRNVLKSYLQYLCEKYKIKTAKRKIACLKAFFNYLEFEDIISVNPFRKVRIQLKEPFNLPKVMTLNEIEKIFHKAYDAITESKNLDSYSFRAHIRDVAVLETLFATGLRVSELCNLKKADIDPKNALIKVNGKGSKERIIFIGNEEVKNALENYRNSFELEILSSEYFFINRLNARLSEQSVRFMINKYVTASGLEKKITPHIFRHSFATLLLEEGVDIKYIQNFLGHSSIVTTQIYTHVNSKKQEEILTFKHPRRNLSTKEMMNGG